jgi:glyoxylase-like metal-dependent hydrolase (beta-lactamase superfamily II)
MIEPTVHRIVIPTPMFEGNVNLYVIPGEPATLIDTGIGTPEALVVLERGLLDLGLTWDAIGRIVLTHKHPDHIGLARQIHTRSGAPVFIHEDDRDNIIHLDTRHEEYPALVRARLEAFGVPQAEIEARSQGLKTFRRLADPVAAEPLTDGQQLPIDGHALEVIHTPGHTQGSICLRFGRYLFTGDHVLPTISPNIGAGELRRSGMLRRYLDSLDRVARLQTNDLVALPGHGEPFTDLVGRVAELKNHHAEREAAIETIVRTHGPLTVYEVAHRLFGRLPGFHLVLGTAEAHVHLEKLAAEGRLTVTEGRYRG